LSRAEALQELLGQDDEWLRTIATELSGHIEDNRALLRS